jgi:hypothetical protein
MRPAADDIGGKSLAGLFGGADFGPIASSEGDFDAPAPRVFMHALTLPTEIEEANCGWPVRKRAREHWLASVILLDLQDEVESFDLPELNTPGRDPAFRILQAEP